MALICMGPSKGPPRPPDPLREGVFTLPHALTDVDRAYSVDATNPRALTHVRRARCVRGCDERCRRCDLLWCQCRCGAGAVVPDYRGDMAVVPHPLVALAGLVALVHRPYPYDPAAARAAALADPRNRVEAYLRAHGATVTRGDGP